MRLSLLNLFEIVLAYCAVFLADQFAHTSVGWDTGNFLLLGVFYPCKACLAVAGRRNRLIAVIGYLGLVSLGIAWLVARYWSESPSLGLFVWASAAFFAPPSVSFAVDLLRDQLPSARVVIWRSLAEILLVFPAWVYATRWFALWIGILQF